MKTRTKQKTSTKVKVAVVTMVIASAAIAAAGAGLRFQGPHVVLRPNDIGEQTIVAQAQDVRVLSFSAGTKNIDVLDIVELPVQFTGRDGSGNPLDLRSVIDSCELIKVVDSVPNRVSTIATYLDPGTAFGGTRDVPTVVFQGVEVTNQIAQFDVRCDFVANNFAPDETYEIFFSIIPGIAFALNDEEMNQFDQDHGLDTLQTDQDWRRELGHPVKLGATNQGINPRGGRGSFTMVAHGTLQVRVAADTPPSAELVPDAEDVHIATYEFNATGEDFLIDGMLLLNCLDTDPQFPCSDQANPQWGNTDVIESLYIKYPSRADEYQPLEDTYLSARIDSSQPGAIALEPDNFVNDQIRIIKDMTFVVEVYVDLRDYGPVAAGSQSTIQDSVALNDKIQAQLLLSVSSAEGADSGIDPMEIDGDPYSSPLALPLKANPFRYPQLVE